MSRPADQTEGLRMHACTQEEHSLPVIQMNPSPVPSQSQTQPTQPPMNRAMSQPPLPPPPPIHPVDARRARSHQEEDVSMGNPIVPPAKKSRSGVTTDKEGPEKLRGPRQSEVSSQIDTKAVVQEILNTEISLPLRKILGTSKEISHTLQEYIRPRNRPNIAPTLTANQTLPIEPTEENGSLIRVLLEYKGIPIEAIIDTGSQLNIV